MRGQMRLHLVVGRRTAALRRWLAPRPWVRRVVLVASAAVFVTAVADHRHDLTAARAAWGDTKPVWVARTDSVAGEQLVTDEEIDQMIGVSTEPGRIALHVTLASFSVSAAIALVRPSSAVLPVT